MSSYHFIGEETKPLRGGIGVNPAMLPLYHQNHCLFSLKLNFIHLTHSWNRRPIILYGLNIIKKMYLEKSCQYMWYVCFLFTF